MEVETRPTFFRRVMAATPGGEVLLTCLQCGTCGGSCPSGQDMDATPRKLFAMARANMEDDVLNSSAPWYCVSCYYCAVRCPPDIPITDFMYTFKRMAIDEGRYHKESHADFSESFIGYACLPFSAECRLGITFTENPPNAQSSPPRTVRSCASGTPPMRAR